jgi:hypothetical protein
MRPILTLCLVAMILPSPSAGQTDSVLDWPVAPGSRVRILSPVLGKRPAIGSVVSATPDTLMFRPASESKSMMIPTRSIVTIELARGTHTNTARGGFAGFVVGALLGSMIAFVATPPPCTNCLDFSQGAAALGGGLAGGVIGSLVGVAIGKRPSDTWVPVTVPSAPYP